MQGQVTIRTMLLAAAVLLTTTVASQATPISSLFSTGVDAAGLSRANNATELHYTLAAAPAGAVTALRVATSANGFPLPPWLGDTASSAWIGPDSGGGNDLDGPVGRYTYRTVFDLSGLQAVTASIVGKWSADNSGLDIVLNGGSAGFIASGFQSFYDFTLSRGFIDGVNTLDFILRNDGGPTGLRVDLTGSADSTPVPEPVSLAILASGLFVAGLLRRKRA